MDHVLEYMKKRGIPITRENYLFWNFLGDPPDELDAELEAELPEEIKLPARARKARKKAAK